MVSVPLISYRCAQCHWTFGKYFGAVLRHAKAIKLLQFFSSRWPSNKQTEYMSADCLIPVSSVWASWLWAQVHNSA